MRHIFFAVLVSSIVFCANYLSGGEPLAAFAFIAGALTTAGLSLASDL